MMRDGNAKIQRNVIKRQICDMYDAVVVEKIYEEKVWSKIMYVGTNKWLKTIDSSVQ